MALNDDRNSVSQRLLEEGVDPFQEEEIDSDSTSAGLARSQWALTKREIAKGIANRFVHSRSYIFLYLGMAGLSVATVVLSLTDGCPGIVFYVLEIIINSAMILEVAIRLLAFGRQFWKSPFNAMDLALTLLCVITVCVIVFAGCGRTSKEEELLDTLLLVARNVLQFARLASVMRKSGQSIFTRPKPIDLTLPHRFGSGGGFALDIDLEDDDEVRPLGAGRNVVFDAEQDRRQRAVQQQRRIQQRPGIVDSGDADDTWAAIG
ncbi:hypothetical protein FRC03_004080 [Tulasnella sp. 419]|nr:hypothetical protein FRC02_008121 [Tulasnella sp. 418]KAG8970698.1 hypothetical protein FRC03_004080 [Tulasnella sp. 419]